MAEEFVLKNIDKTRNYFIEEIISFILASTVTGCIFISAFVFLVGISIGITSSVIALEISAITETIKNYKSIIKKITKKHNTIVLLAKNKLNITEALNSQAIIDSNICHDEFVLINNVLKEYDHMIEKNQKSKHLKSLSKILVCLLKNVMVLFEASKKYEK